MSRRNADVTNRTGIVTGAIAKERGAIANVIYTITDAAHDNTNVPHHTTVAEYVQNKTNMIRIRMLREP